jgi:hypothetical protein
MLIEQEEEHLEVPFFDQVNNDDSYLLLGIFQFNSKLLTLCIKRNKNQHNFSVLQRNDGEPRDYYGYLVEFKCEQQKRRSGTSRNSFTSRSYRQCSIL